VSNAVESVHTSFYTACVDTNSLSRCCHLLRIFFRVVAVDYAAARNIVHGVFNNAGNQEPLPIQFEVRSLFE
jgi:hypothetical protein